MISMHLKIGDRVRDTRQSVSTEMTGIVTSIVAMQVQVNHVTWYGSNGNNAIKHLQLAEVAS